MLKGLKKISKYCILTFALTGVTNASASLFTLEEVNGGTSSAFTQGPYAKSLSNGENPYAVSLMYKNNIFSYFDMGADQFDIGQVIHRVYDCPNYFSTDVCEILWETSGARKWRDDFIQHKSQYSSILNNVESVDTDMLVYKVGDNGETFGSKVDYSQQRALNGFDTYGVAKIDGKTFYLKSPTEDYFYRDKESIGNLATALTYYKLPSGKYLVGGYSQIDKNRSDDRMSYCLNYLASEYGDGNYYNSFCPSFKTEATIWLIDPSQMNDGDFIKGTHAPRYLDMGREENVISTASVTSFVEFEGKIYALGYSTTDEYYGVRAFSPVATYWGITVNETDNTVEFGEISELKDLERPGEGDGWNAYTWVQSVNNNGYIVANRQLNKSENSTYARNLVISKLTADGKTEKISYPLFGNIAKGFSSEGMSINDDNFVVGLCDDREYYNVPTSGGSPKPKEAMFYDLNAAKFYRINDFICSKIDGNEDCSINGAYYYIERAIDINDKNYILATAFKYANQTDWSKRQNSSVVTVLLKPNDSTFVTDAEGKKAINESEIVEYNRVKPNYYKKDNGGGSFGVFGLIMLMLSAVLLKRRKV